MICPFCKNDEDKVIDSRTNGTSIRRRRECLSCGKRFTTYEYVEKTPLTVIKKDGRREEFSREKLVQGIVFSCKKRPVSMETINGIVNSIENQLFALCVQEVSYSQIGNLVMQELQKVDQVAYVRFASVYKHFEEVQEFVDQVLSLNDLKKIVMDILNVLEKSWAARKHLLASTQAFRIINGEIPGITLDKFANHYQLQFFSPKFLDRESEIAGAIKQIFSPEFLVVKYRLDNRGLALESPEIKIIIGENSKTIVKEGSCVFEVDLTDTVNPGLFLDMREIRIDAESRARGRSVLNLFSYTCSFGVHARMGGARVATNVDISGKILEKGRRNYALNGIEILPGEFFKGNAFEYLNYAKRKQLRFDLIILDPPSFARFKGFSFNVKKNLGELVEDSCEVLSANGELMASSNFSGFSPRFFENLVMSASRKILKNPQKIWQKTQSEDFTFSGQTKDSCLNAILLRNVV